jgi:serralysin
MSRWARRGHHMTIQTEDGIGTEFQGANTATLGTITQLSGYLVNGYWAWQGTNAHHWGSNTITYNLGNLTASEQTLALSALNAWHEVANIKFFQSASANIKFNHNGSQTAVTNANWTGAGLMTSAAVDISSNWARGFGTGIDSYLYQTYIHEIGHALGLGHQGPYNGSATYGVDNIFTNDTWQFAVMSYNSQDNFDGGSYRYVLTPMMSDTTAIQSIY